MNAADAAAAEQAYLEGWRHFWHPVATVEELDAPRPDELGRQQPLGVQLAGQRLVLARLAGKLVALDGTCPHRGTGLHVGWLSDDGSRVVCRYHGAEWDAGGKLDCFPAFRVEGRQPPEWRLPSYEVAERHGLVWVSLVPDPKLPILDLPELRQAGFVRTPWRVQTWSAGVGRQIEAALDTYHFAFTHVGTIGDRDNPRAPEVKPEVVGDRLTFSYTIDQPANDGIAAEGREREGLLPVTYVMQATPNAVHLKKVSEAGSFIIYFAWCSVGPRSTRWYRLIVRDHHLGVPHDVYMDFEDRINAQDQYVVETMEPWFVSTDLEDELHVYPDRPTVGYRRWAASLGLRWV